MLDRAYAGAFGPGRVRCEIDRKGGLPPAQGIASGRLLNDAPRRGQIVSAYTGIRPSQTCETGQYRYRQKSMGDPADRLKVVWRRDRDLARARGTVLRPPARFPPLEAFRTPDAEHAAPALKRAASETAVWGLSLSSREWRCC